MADYRLADCQCQTCKSEHRDLIDLDHGVKLTTHGKRKVKQECDACLELRAGTEKARHWTALKSRLAVNAPLWVPPER